ncbi:MAG: hypothetical protein BJ554DRAFT_5203, partial [Olpidium bornovanus]
AAAAAAALSHAAGCRPVSAGSPGDWTSRGVFSPTADGGSAGTGQGALGAAASKPKTAAAAVLQPGTALLQQAPYVCVVDDRNLATTCSYCFRSTESAVQPAKALLLCSVCQTVRYCSRHGMPGLCLRQTAARPCGGARLLSNLAKESEGPGITCLDGDTPVPPASEMIALWCKFTCNSFSVTDGELVNRGVGIYTQVAMLNHSCDPNCVVVFDGNVACVRNILPLQPGEELTVS